MNEDEINEIPPERFLDRESVLRMKLKEVKNERDEALAELDNIFRLIQRHNQDGFIDSLGYCKNLQRCFDLLNDKIDTMREERNKIRRERDQLFQTLSDIQMWIEEDLAKGKEIE